MQTLGFDIETTLKILTENFDEKSAKEFLYMQYENLHNINDLESNNEQSHMTCFQEKIDVEVFRKFSKFLLTGESGSGKTKYALDVCKNFCSDYLQQTKVIQMTPELDRTLLVGSFVNGNVVGRFEWRFGVLLDSLINGKILILEDIDFANSETLILLSSILKFGQIYVNEIGMDVKINPASKIIFTSK